MPRFILVFTLAVTAVAVPMWAAHPAHVYPTKNGKPIYDEEAMFITAGTLEQLYDTANDVLELQVVSREVKGVGARPHVRTFYTGKVLKTYKGNVKNGSSIIFSQFAGELELSDKVLRSLGRDPIPVGERYIVFLQKAGDELGGRILIGETESVFHIHNGRIEPRGTGRVAEEQRYLTEQQFVDELGRVARLARPKA